MHYTFEHEVIKNCGVCPVSRFDERTESYQCKSNYEIIASEKERPKECPLNPIIIGKFSGSGKQAKVEVVRCHNRNEHLEAENKRVMKLADERLMHMVHAKNESQAQYEMLLAQNGLMLAMMETFLMHAEELGVSKEEIYISTERAAEMQKKFRIASTETENGMMVRIEQKDAPEENEGVGEQMVESDAKLFRE